MYEELIKELRDCRNKAVLSEYWWDITSRAADAIEDLITALTASNEVIAKSKPKWIPVTERLPEDGAEVLAFNKTGFAYVDCWTDGKWKINSMVDEEHESVTHWMPLPQPPESEGRNEDAE